MLKKIKYLCDVIFHPIVILLTILYSLKRIIQRKRIGDEHPKTDSGKQRRKLYLKTPSKNYFNLIPNGFLRSTFESVSHSSEFIANKKGTIFHFQQWVPQTQPKSVVCFIHGYGSCALFTNEFVCRGIASKGFKVVAMDGFGHGLSDGLHCYIPSFEHYVDDFYYCYSKVAKSNSDLKCFLFGASMGGAVIIELLNRDKNCKLFSGAILSSPMLKINENMKRNFILMEIGKAFARVFPAARPIPSNSRDEYFFKNVETAKLFKNKIFYDDSPRLGTTMQLLDVCERIQKNSKIFKHSILIHQGDEDKVTCPKTAKQFFDSVSGGDKEFKSYKGERHELFFEDCSKEVFDDMINWLEKRS